MAQGSLDLGFRFCYLGRPRDRSVSEESIVRPKPIPGLEREKIVFIPFDPGPGLILAGFKPKIRREMLMWAGRLLILEDKAVLYGDLGAPAAVAALEGLIASGARQILVLSFCGSLDQTYIIKDVVSISRALADEGTSLHYFPRRKMYAPSDGLKADVESRLKSSGLPFQTGSLVSTDAPFRETTTWLARFQKKKIGLVDMEASAVFALAEFRGIDAAALMIVTDELFPGVWKQTRYDREFKKKIRDYFLPFI
jgi:purine-nucleoside phosphorylase